MCIVNSVQMMTEEGHVGLSNKKVKEASSEHFRMALSYLEKDPSTAYFVIHIYSSTFDDSPYLQRSNVGRVRAHRKNFLERLGFTHYPSCNILGGECYFKIMGEVNRGQFWRDSIAHMRRNEIIHNRFSKFASQIGDIFEKMREVDKMLLNAGFELPWEELRLAPVDYGKEEKVYPKGHIYDFYKDIRDIAKDAKNEVFVIDAYVNEELLNLYLEKIPVGVKIRILTNKPKGSFVTIAKKFKMKPKVDFEVRKSKDCHDRLFFVDNKCWVMGQSVKDAGKKPTYLIKIEGYDLFRTVFDNLWKNASALI